MKGIFGDAVTTVAQFYLRPGQLARRDVFPAVRVTDFRLEKTFNSSLFVSLAWTAPGDDLTFGTAFRYEVRCFTKQEALTQATFSEQGILIHDSLVPAPEPAGTEQRATVGVPWPNEVFYYAMVAQDAAGNRNEVSNTVAELVEEPLTTTTRQPAIRFFNMKEDSRVRAGLPGQGQGALFPGAQIKDHPTVKKTCDNNIQSRSNVFVYFVLSIQNILVYNYF